MLFRGYRTRFKGVLAGIKVEKLRELDYSLEKFNDRLNFIQDKYNRLSPFFDLYVYTKSKSDYSLVKLEEGDYKEFYKVNLNTKDELSHEVNIFKYIENDGSYLLNSIDLPVEKKDKFIFLAQADFDALLSIEDKKDIYEDEIITMLEQQPTGIYKNVDLKIEPKDFKDSRSRDILLDYQNLKDKLKTEAIKIKNKEKSYLTIKKIQKISNEITTDMKICKVSYQGIRSHAKRLGDESGYFDLSMIDYTNIKHIEQIIKHINLNEIRPDSNLSIIGFDIGNSIKKLRKDGVINSIEITIVKMYNLGYSKTKIAQKLNCDEKNIRYHLNKVYKKISCYFKKNNNF